MIYTLGSLFGVRWFPFLCGCRGTKIQPRFLVMRTAVEWGSGYPWGIHIIYKGTTIKDSTLNKHIQNLKLLIHSTIYLHSIALSTNPHYKQRNTYILPTIILHKIIRKKNKETIITTTYHKSPYLPPARPPKRPPPPLQNQGI